METVPAVLPAATIFGWRWGLELAGPTPKRITNYPPPTTIWSL
jgi:hypothetical protein